MRLVTGLCLILGFLILTGCSMQQPKTAEEFRKMLPESMFGKHETVEVKRAYSKVVDTFKKRAGKCLNVAVERTTTNGYGQVVGRSTITYVPTFKVGKKKSELHIQQQIEGNAIVLGGEMPEKGYYMYVVDLFDAGKSKTRMEIYRGSIGSDTLTRAINNWAEGTNMGCPDMTQG